ncbi:hypothetical protein [Gemmobacter sp. LW-1]|uniref:hypothetical protein n=1 Tax=Gemmobacter sp. LW-1 TaxID=1529005 RepID=UPI00128EDF12|nr:hypothetical protein [Gemmobacter sp. LW-1]
MGRAKAAMMEHEENLTLAARYLVQKGVLEECEIHGEIYGDGWDLENDFWKFAMADRNRGDNGPIPWAAALPARTFTDLLKEANETYIGDGCGYCAKNAAD